VSAAAVTIQVQPCNAVLAQNKGARAQARHADVTATMFRLLTEHDACALTIMQGLPT